MKVELGVVTFFYINTEKLCTMCAKYNFLILNEFAPVVHNLGKLAQYYTDAPKGPY